MYVKAFVSETADKACPGSWENSRPPGALLQITAWGQMEAPGPLCSRERQMTTCPWEQLTAQDRNVAASESQSPHRTLFILHNKKKSGLERKDKMVC